MPFGTSRQQHCGLGSSGRANRCFAKSEFAPMRWRGPVGGGGALDNPDQIAAIDLRGQGNYQVECVIPLHAIALQDHPAGEGR